ncbi:hypothetical protein Ciccas_011684, partial [Cichlidogyrus casuarinus]
MRLILLLLQLLALLPFHESRASVKSRERALFEKLTKQYKNYGTLGRPINRTHTKIEVHFSLQLIQVLQLNANQQTLSSAVWFNY